MTPGSTLQASIATSAVQDLSAVTITQVLGINTVKYILPAAAAAGTTSANGTLAATGQNVDLATPALLILLGSFLFGLMIIVKKRNQTL